MPAHARKPPDGPHRPDPERQHGSRQAGGRGGQSARHRPHQERKYGASKYRSTKILTEIPDLLTLYFLLNYTRRPLHFFGKIGSVLCALGLASLTYLTVLWFRGIPIGTRPLLTFGVLMMVVGAQIVFTGLLADLIVNMDQDRSRDVPLKYVSDQDGSSEGWVRQEHGREWDARTAERGRSDR
jgi:hypothetical protein